MHELKRPPQPTQCALSELSAKQLFISPTFGHSSPGLTTKEKKKIQHPHNDSLTHAHTQKAAKEGVSRCEGHSLRHGRAKNAVCLPLPPPSLLPLSSPLCVSSRKEGTEAGSSWTRPARHLPPNEAPLHENVHARPAPPTTRTPGPQGQF